MLVDNPGDQEGGGLYQPSLDYTGKHTGRPSAIGSIGPGPLEGTHIHSLTHTLMLTHHKCAVRGKSQTDVNNSLLSAWLL